jgi:hypothetical protein
MFDRSSFYPPGGVVHYPGNKPLTSSGVRSPILGGSTPHLTLELLRYAAPTVKRATFDRPGVIACSSDYTSGEGWLPHQNPIISFLARPPVGGYLRLSTSGFQEYHCLEPNVEVLSFGGHETSHAISQIIRTLLTQQHTEDALFSINHTGELWADTTDTFLSNACDAKTITLPSGEKQLWIFNPDTQTWYQQHYERLDAMPTPQAHTVANKNPFALGQEAHYLYIPPRLLQLQPEEVVSYSINATLNTVFNQMPPISPNDANSFNSYKASELPEDLRKAHVSKRYSEKLRTLMALLTDIAPDTPFNPEVLYKEGQLALAFWHRLLKQTEAITLPSGAMLIPKRQKPSEFETFVAIHRSAESATRLPPSSDCVNIRPELYLRGTNDPVDRYRQLRQQLTQLTHQLLEQPAHNIPPEHWLRDHPKLIDLWQSIRGITELSYKASLHWWA